MNGSPPVELTASRDDPETHTDYVQSRQGVPVADEKWSWGSEPGDDADATRVHPRVSEDAASDSTVETAPAAASTARRPAGVHRDRENDFGRTVIFTILGAIVPGVGLLAAKRRVAGFVMLGVFVLGLAALAVWFLAARDSMIGFLANGANLKLIGIALVVIGALWVGVVVASHLALRGKRLPRSQQIGGSILVALLAFVIAAPTAVAARYSYASADVVNSVFKTEGHTNSATRPHISTAPNNSDPWAQTPRVNILLLGGDSGADRTGTRTDTMIVASIDTHSGNTVLFGIPRNTAQMPFPADSPLHTYYPNGFTTSGNSDGQNAEFFANAIYGNVPNKVPKDVLGKTDNLGADALKLSVGEALGIPIDYYTLINLAGFKELVNALGGITVNVNTYIPIGGDRADGRLPTGYLTPGANQHFKGENALWYARSRYAGDDFDRMGRQRCVINALVEQANPSNVLARYEQIAKAGKDLVQTDIPQEELGALVGLSLRVKSADNVRSVNFVSGQDGFVSGHPDFGLVRKRVKAALTETSTKPTASSAASPTKAASSKSSAKKTSSSAKSTASQDVSQGCAFQPSVAASARQGG